MSLPYESADALTVQQVRELDVLAIEHVGIPGLVLMENAGRRIAEVVYAALIHPAAERVTILCGPGNNGGDGLVIARHLHNAGVRTTVVLAVGREKLKGDAGTNLGIVERMDVPVLPAEDAGVAAAIADADVIVDALLGTGAKGDPRGALAALIEQANAAPRARRIAVDVPSGLDADTGARGSPCFAAGCTVTLLAPKVGFAEAAAQTVLGRVVVADIGVPRELIPRSGKTARPLDS